MYNIRYILPAERTWKYDTPVAVSISSAQILFPKFYSVIKETRAYGEVVATIAVAKKIYKMNVEAKKQGCAQTKKMEAHNRVRG